MKVHMGFDVLNIKILQRISLEHFLDNHRKLTFWPF